MSAGLLGVEDAEDLVLFQDDVLFAIELDLGAGVLAEQDGVTLGDVEGHAAPVVEDATFADGDDDATLGLFFGRVGDVQAAGGLGFFGDALNQHAIVERTNFHGWLFFRWAPWSGAVCSVSCWVGYAGQGSRVCIANP